MTDISQCWLKRGVYGGGCTAYGGGCTACRSSAYNYGRVWPNNENIGVLVTLTDSDCAHCKSI